MAASFSICLDREEVYLWVIEHIKRPLCDPNFQAVGIKRDGKMIAGVVYDHYAQRSINMHVAGEGKWATKHNLRIFFDYPFNQLQVNKVVGYVDSTQQKIINFDKHLGFVEESIIKDAGYWGDIVILTMTKEQCRFLGD
jgi:RimJ/RimL family protein N-acetyltransferase